jgi:hypothetical protein
VSPVVVGGPITAVVHPNATVSVAARPTAARTNLRPEMERAV